MGRFLLTLLLVLIAIRVARRLLAQASRGGVRVPGEESAGDDPYVVLGVPRGAPPEEIARAYREQMKRYHPDRVANLGDELQRVAHRKTLEIQRAYDLIGKR